MKLGDISISNESEFVILEKFNETEKWLGRVAEESDAHRNEFGFFANSIFREYAWREGLYVLVKRSELGDEYSGHLLFDARHPRAKVLQIYTLKKLRGRGAASFLVNHLKRALTRHNFTSIYARVAEDLSVSNSFWESQGFYIQSIAAGGRTTGRKILVRCFQLDTPQLFPAADLGINNPLGLLSPPRDELPLFLLDMNVLFDLQPRRPRRNDVLGLIQAERLNLCRLAISDEVRKELEKTAKKERNTDPMEAVIDSFPCVPVDPVGESDALVNELAKIVFPSVIADRPLNSNERSDLRHIVAVINNDLAGIVTSDGAILEAARVIEEKFRVQVRSPASFMIGVDQCGEDHLFESSNQSPLKLTHVLPTDEPKLRKFLSENIGLSGSTIAVNWLSLGNLKPVTERYAVWDCDNCVAYVTWPSWSAGGAITVRVAVDDSCGKAIEAARIVLTYTIDRLCIGSPRQLKLDVAKNQSVLREIAMGIGFGGSGNVLAKTSAGCLVTAQNWNEVSASLAAVGGPRISELPPAFSAHNQKIMIYRPDETRIHVGLDQLETLLSPMIFGLRGRPAVITPIRRDFAESLLGHSPQVSLLPKASASLFRKRIYISSNRAACRHFKPGTIIFFYESSANKGSKQIVALARVRESYLKNCDDIDVNDLERSVLKQDQLQTTIGVSKMKTVVAFDNVLPIPKPVGLRSLVKLGCGDAVKLLTTRPITSEQYESIIELGFGRE